MLLVIEACLASSNSLEYSLYLSRIIFVSGETASKSFFLRANSAFAFLILALPSSSNKSAYFSLTSLTLALAISASQ